MSNNLKNIDEGCGCILIAIAIIILIWAPDLVHAIVHWLSK